MSTLTGSSWAMTEHQPRERAVTCRQCLRHETWEYDAVCSSCKRAVYLTWAKKRAFDYLDKGHHTFALSFFLEDLGLRPYDWTPSIAELYRHRQDTAEQIRAVIESVR
jgi:hypothetical protein